MTNNIFMVFIPEHFSSPKLRFTDVWKMSTRGTKHSGIKISRLLVGWLGVDLVFSEALDNDWEAFSLLLNRRSDDFVTLEVARVSKVLIRGEEVDLSLPASDVVIGFSLTLSLIGVTPGGKLLTVFRPDSDVIGSRAHLLIHHCSQFGRRHCNWQGQIIFQRKRFRGWTLRQVAEINFRPFWWH